MTEEKKDEKPRFINATNYLRCRPRAGANPAFYAPSADITHGMKAVASTTLKVFNNPNNPKLGEFALDLAHFMKTSAMGGKTWEADGLPMLEGMLGKLTPEEQTQFLTTFFQNTMDFYWHAMRLSTDCPEINDEEMQKALDMSYIIRSMPPHMRQEYIDHVRTYNILPQVFNKKGLFEMKPD